MSPAVVDCERRQIEPLEDLGVRVSNDFDDAFTAMVRKPPDAILMVTDVLTTLNRQRVIDFTAEHKVQAMYEYDFLVGDGGLMSYGPDVIEMFDRAAAPGCPRHQRTSAQTAGFHF